MASALWPVAFAVLVNAPARYAMASREHQFGVGITETFALGVLADIACLAPVFAFALAPSDWLAARRSGDRSAARTAIATAMVTVAVVGAFMWAVSVGATEFRIQRGSYPTPLETIDGLADRAFIRGSAKIALFERYSWPTLVALFALTAVLVAYGKARLGRRGTEGSARRAPIGTVIGSLAWAGLAAILFFLIRALAPAATSGTWLPPLVRLAADAASRRSSGQQGGMRTLLASIDLGEPAVRSGLHWLGFGDAHARCLTQTEPSVCPPHPLARPLPGDAQSMTPALSTEDPTPLVQGFLALSAALFDQRETPLTVWHVALESFRADDVHALHPAAPAELTPFMNAAYAPFEPGGPRTVAFRHAFQSGLRTAQAVSGLWCGLGALPFQLALSRDLTDLPLRCMPEVLRDAGFDARIYYGSNASFEHLGEFALQHGLAVTDVSTLPADLPRGAFRAVTDAALLGIARRDSEQVGPLAYRFVLTLSGHSPFDLPEDVSPMTQTSAGNAIAERLTASVAPEDRRRLVTMAYTDQALAAFVQEVEASSQAARSIFLLSADHATADPFLWEKPTTEAMARVPLILYLPTALIAASKDPVRVEAELRSLGVFASTLPVSINDVPTLLLALVARHPAIERLSRDRRWHTLGGATTSPHFKAREETTAQVWGIDASSRVFLVRHDAVDQLFDTGERSVALSVWDEPLGPLLKDVTAALSAVLRACSGARARWCVGETCCSSSRQSISD
jgi:hypothetical protein